MVTIIFEAHATSKDNEARRASGWNDVDLSQRGVIQSEEMGERYHGQKFDVVFCSDLIRSHKTAEIAFGKRFPIMEDQRLRECDYGDLTCHSSAGVDIEKPKRINTPFPNGESYEQTNDRMKDFLKDLLRKYDGRKVLIIGHRATQYGLEHWTNGTPLEKIISAPWKWQPGWTYHLEKI